MSLGYNFNIKNHINWERFYLKEKEIMPYRQYFNLILKSCLFDAILT